MESYIKLSQYFRPWYHCTWVAVIAWCRRPTVNWWLSSQHILGWTWKISQCAISILKHAIQNRHVMWSYSIWIAVHWRRQAIIIIKKIPGRCFQCYHLPQSHCESCLRKCPQGTLGTLEWMWSAPNGHQLTGQSATLHSSPLVGCYRPDIHPKAFVLLRSYKAANHLNVPQRGEGRVELGTAVRVCSPCQKLHWFSWKKRRTVCSAGSILGPLAPQSDVLSTQL